MKFISSLSHCAMALVALAGLSASPSFATAKSTVIGGNLITLADTCAGKKEPEATLKKYLNQYDVTEEIDFLMGMSEYFNETIYEGYSDPDYYKDKENIKEIKNSITEEGFHYLIGLSKITWMDFNNDGVCDFTAISDDSGGMRIQRYRLFLFKGQKKVGYKLTNYFFVPQGYSAPIVPFMPVRINNEKYPFLFFMDQGDSTATDIFQWDPALNKLIGCEKQVIGAKFENKSILLAKKITVIKKQPSICSNPQKEEIKQWVKNQLPYKNQAPRAPINPP